MEHEIKIRLICCTDNKTQILYKHKIMPTVIYNLFRKVNHKLYSVATGENAILEKLMQQKKIKE